MGATRECHVRLSPTVGGAILLERGGRLLIKSPGVGGSAMPVDLDVPSEFGELRFSIQAWPSRSGIGKVIG
jgi:hypothetical protein